MRGRTNAVVVGGGAAMCHINIVWAAARDESEFACYYDDGEGLIEDYIDYPDTRSIDIPRGILLFVSGYKGSASVIAGDAERLWYLSSGPSGGEANSVIHVYGDCTIQVG